VIALARRDGRPLLIGHRGAADLAPENTLRSFRAAVAAGVDLVELDVLQLEAGELVVAHSNDLHEVSHGLSEGSVRDRTLVALRELAPELPTLDEALAYFREEATEVGVHLDLKSREPVDALVDALRRFELCERALVSSFHLGALRRLTHIEGRVRTGASFPRDRLGISGRRTLEPAVRATLRVLREVTPALARVLLARSGASTLVLHHALVTARTVERAHARGVPVVAWTIDDSRDFDRLDRAGVDALVVNNPSRFVSTLEP
jgi:glycerophosphoryl diester phosphodiesterase